MRRRLLTAALVAIGALVAACTPSGAPPVLPPDVGVEWLRDTGGTFTPGPISGTYFADWQRYDVLGGAVSGPVPSTVSVYPITAAAALGRLLPNGAASFPWNGFAGTGITMTTSPSVGDTITHVVSIRGEVVCTLYSMPWSDIRGFVPSPDDNMYAMLTVNHDVAPGTVPTRVTIGQLSAGCPVVTSVAYTGQLDGGRGGSGDSVRNPGFVWGHETGSILYSLHGPTAADEGRVVRLDARAGATPVTLFDDGPTTTLIPTGWGVGYRILLSRFAAPVSGSQTSTIEISLDGNRRVIDTATTVPGSSLPAGLHFGYFVPGTATVAYDSGSTRVTSPQGISYPWFRVRLYDDVTWGQAPVLGVEPPLTWHDEGGTQVPNAELLQTFVR